MELFIKKEGCKCDPQVRKFQEVSMIFCHIPLIIFVLSLLRAFPIAREYYNDIEFISKKIYSDKITFWLIPITAFWFLNIIYNGAVYNCNIKKMKVFGTINIIFSVCFLILFSVYTAEKNYELQFSGYIIMISPILSAFFEFLETSTQKHILKVNSNCEDQS